MFYYGACYYPEHWTPEQAQHHIKLMQEAGINMVRMGEFSWCKFEPDPGRYRFEWLDETIAALYKAGIATILCTPTCIPPQWAVQRHPGILQMDAEGRVRNPGARCHACKNANEYWLMAEQITQAMVRHYADREGVIGWQTDNEFGCHNTTRCYCPHCEKAFRDWLLAKYGDVDRVNEAWGTAFWGFTFRQWTDIPLPRRMPTGCNPGHWLDYARFSSDTQVKFQKMQYDLIKSFCPKHFVTHNYMGRFSEIDYYKLSEYVDFPCWDNYPDPYGDPYSEAYAHEITRSFKGRYWVMEQKSGPTGDAADGILGEQPEPGELRRWVFQSVGNGADGISYFRWRACLTGAEQYWHGILDHDGVPKRRYAEIRKTGEELHKVAAELKGTVVTSPVALIRSFDALWSIEKQPGATNFTYDGHCFDWYRAVRQSGLGCDIINTNGAFSRYKLIIAPCLSLVDEALAANLETFVKAGGTLVLTPQSGARTISNAMSDKTRPGLLAGLSGINIYEVRPYHHGQTEEVRFTQGPLAGKTCTVGTWVEILRPTGAEPVAEFTAEMYAGKPAVTCHTLGNGKVYYFGILPERDVLAAFMAGLLPEHPFADMPDGIEVTRRRGKDARYFFVINHARERKTITLPAPMQDLLSGETVGPRINMSVNGVLLLKG